MRPLVPDGSPPCAWRRFKNHGPAANKAVANSSNQGTSPENTLAGVTSSSIAPRTPPTEASTASRLSWLRSMARSSERNPHTLPR